LKQAGECAKALVAAGRQSPHWRHTFDDFKEKGYPAGAETRW